MTTPGEAGLTPTFCPCPMCSVFALLQDVSPAALEHLATAAAELAAAARAMLGAVEDGNRGPRPGGSGSIQRIDIN